MPNGRCRFHGGMSLAGPAHPAFKHGRYSKYLPAQLRERYETARDDDRLIELRDDVAIIDLRIGELLEQIGETGSTGLLKAARLKFDAFKSAGGKGKASVGQARISLQELDDLLTLGLQRASTWEELRDSIELRRRLTESETKRMKDLQQFITADRAIALVGMFLEVVLKHVVDPAARSSISSQYQRLVGAGDRPPTQS